MKLIDSHLHLSFFSQQSIKNLLQRPLAHKLEACVMAGYDFEDWEKQILIFDIYKNVRMSFGLHPWRVLELSEAQIDQEMIQLEGLLSLAHACGETGIDGFKTSDPHLLRRQEDVFIKHLELNKKYGLPLVLHIVKSHERCLQILRQYSFKGILHGFSGSWEVAQQYIELGYKISIGRGIYHKGFKNLKETALKIGLHDFVIESDAGLDGEGHEEEPLLILSQVLKALSEIKSLPLEKIGLLNSENIQNVFGVL